MKPHSKVLVLFGMLIVTTTSQSFSNEHEALFSKSTNNWLRRSAILRETSEIFGRSARKMEARIFPLLAGHATAVGLLGGFALLPSGAGCWNSAIITEYSIEGGVTEKSGNRLHDFYYQSEHIWLDRSKVDSKFQLAKSLRSRSRALTRSELISELNTLNSDVLENISESLKALELFTSAMTHFTAEISNALCFGVLDFTYYKNLEITYLFQARLLEELASGLERKR